MSGINPETEGSAWTDENLKKLLAAMKACIPNQDRHYAYVKGMKDMVWKKVAFSPFSPEECQEKWLEIIKRMRKVRTLTELITEAEEVISSSPDALKKYQKSLRRGKRNKKRKKLSEDTSDDELSSEDEEGLPSKPPVNGYGLFCKEQLAFMDDISKSACWSEYGKRWRGLTEDQRGDYSKRCRDLKNQYLKELDKYLKTLNKKKQKRFLNKHGIKRSTVKTKIVTRFPGEPKKPLRSSNLIFFKEQMELLKEEIPNPNKRFTKISQMWKDLSDTEKRRYRERVIKNNRKYVAELQKWFKTLKPAERDDYLKSNPSHLQYLDSIPLPREKKESSRRPSDSEDEDIEDSTSSDEELSEPAREESEEEEEEEEEDDISFNMY